ncbi:MAG: topoisomerase C-terminal repeat-containing protein, partial [Bacteroidaceae bacterium]
YGNFTPLVSKASDKQTELRVGERRLGVDPASGRILSVKIGRYGPVVQMGLASDDEKPRFARLSEGKSMDTITLEEALELFKLPRVLGKVDDREVIANVSRFGPYISYNHRNVSIPKEIDVMNITLEQAMQLIEEKDEAEKKRVIHSFEGGIEVMNGRYGPYIAYNGKNYRLPKTLAADLDATTAQQCREVIEKTGETGTRRRKHS